MYILETKAKNRVEAMDYETSTIQTVIPERHAIMGRKFYGKIVSLIGSGFCGKGGFFKNMLKFKMMSSMMGGDTTGNNSFGNALPMMMLMGNGSMDGLFDGFCDDDDEDCNIFDGFQVEDDESEDEEGAVVKKKSVKKTAKKTVKKGR
jgi:hypothetical protein